MVNIKHLSSGFLAFFIGVLMLISFGVTATQAASDGSFDPLGTTCLEAPESTICKERDATLQKNPVTGDDGVLTKIVNLVAVAVSIISVIIIIIAGITMSLSAGDSNKVQSSRNAIIYALVGLVVVALSRAAVVFVINRV